MKHLFITALTLTAFAGAVFLGISLPERTSAQFMQRPSMLSLTVTPQFPTPNSTATVTVSAYGTNMRGATVDWSIDGVAATTSRNALSIAVPTGSGERTIAVVARVSAPEAGTETLTATIAPGAVDLIVEPQTTVPLGFRGKALASSGSSVRVVALPHLYRNGKAVPVSEIFFTWAVNGATILGGAQLGTNVTTVNVPRYGNLEVSVLAEAKDGTRSARATTVVQPVTPKVLFYELSSLYGTIMEAPRRFTTTKDEMAIVAVPYYMNEAAGEGKNLSHTWTVDGATVASEADPRIITLTREGNGTTRRVNHTYTGDSSVYARGVGEFEVMFTSANDVLPTI